MMQRQGAIFDYGLLHMELPSALFILVVFVVTMILLNLLLFKPVVRTIEGRAQILNQGTDRLDEIEKTLSDAQASYDLKQAKLVEEISSNFQAAMTAAAQEAAKLTDAAKQISDDQLASANAEIDSQSQAAIEEGKSLARDLAGMIQTKVLNG